VLHFDALTHPSLVSAHLPSSEKFRLFTFKAERGGWCSWSVSAVVDARIVKVALRLESSSVSGWLGTATNRTAHSQPDTLGSVP